MNKKRIAELELIGKHAQSFELKEAVEEIQKLHNRVEKLVAAIKKAMVTLFDGAASKNILQAAVSEAEYEKEKE